MLVSYVLEPISAFLHNRKRRNPYAHLKWTTNATSVQPQDPSEATEDIPTQSDTTESITIGNTHLTEEDTHARTESSIEPLEEAIRVNQMAVEPQASDVDLPLANYGAVDVGIGLDQVGDLLTEAAVATKEQHNSLEKLAAPREVVY